MQHPDGDITQLLDQVRAGHKEAESRLMETVYAELRRIAGYYLRGERPGHTLQATALVNEAYLQLLGQSGTGWNDRTHFFAAAAQSMRRILVDYARMRKAAKRGGEIRPAPLSELPAMPDERLDEAIALDQALTRLAQWDPRLSRVVELRYFGGLSEDETADVLAVSSRTVSRDWNLARAWLHGELSPTPRHQVKTTVV